MRIGIYPPKSGNEYLARMVEILSKSNDVMVVPPALSFLKCPKLIRRNRYDVLIVNWIENVMVTDGRQGIRVSLKGVLVLLLKFIVYRLATKKLYYVRHNRYPHGLRPMQARVASTLISLLEIMSTQVVIHAPVLKGRRYVYIPHPLYSKSFDPPYKRGQNGYFLVFGRIVRYKKLERVIERLPEDSMLVIAGICEDGDYLHELTLLASGKNIHFLPEYLDACKAQQLAVHSQAILILHDGPDMIVSGSYFYAISFGVPVICMESEFFRWLNRCLSAPGLTVLSDESEIANTLANKLWNQAPLEEIVGFAEKEFGDDAVLSSWCAMLDVNESF